MRHHSDYRQRHMRKVKQLPAEVIEFINGAYQKFREHDFHVESERQIIDWSARQAYIALMGIDSCPHRGLRMDKTSAVLERHFGIDPGRYRPAVMVAVGYRAEAPRHPKTRRDMGQVVIWA